MLIKDRVVVVTGAASGIGRALARRFAGEEGAKLVVCSDRNAEGVRAVAQEEDEEDPVDRPRIPRLEPKRLCSSSRCMICVTATERFSCC